MIQKKAEPAPATKNNGKEHKPTPEYNWAKPISLPKKKMFFKFFFKNFLKYQLPNIVREPSLYFKLMMQRPPAKARNANNRSGEVNLEKKGKNVMNFK